MLSLKQTIYSTHKKVVPTKERKLRTFYGEMEQRQEISRAMPLFPSRKLFIADAAISVPGIIKRPDRTFQNLRAKNTSDQRILCSTIHVV